MADTTEGRREPITCRCCGQPCDRVYHGPNRNHTVEPRREEWTNDAGVTFTGTPDFISGARNADYAAQAGKVASDEVAEELAEKGTRAETALAFYADKKNWRAWIGNGPALDDAGHRAREALNRG